eukprot:CAMPEP_0174237054 /NCGR_PEP_ID=MMETSP0417-20130205/6642_1 /TAXON_ID=242541 /ORGANISM="Mayorella sp, Strain BSH-02190019" /LENGTH=69 /DNA_ID=CAMNT_0015315771 /DNA_START=29 /DNA_END=235 /DNA_ORIENTATION=+
MTFTNSEEAPPPHMLFRAANFLWQSAQNPPLRNVGLFLVTVGAIYFYGEKLVPKADDTTVELMVKQFQE